VLARLCARLACKSEEEARTIKSSGIAMLNSPRSESFKAAAYCVGREREKVRKKKDFFFFFFFFLFFLFLRLLQKNRDRMHSQDQRRFQETFTKRETFLSKETLVIDLKFKLTET
jgi:hypothetical protein